MTRFYIGVAVALALTLAPAALNGRYLNRWGNPPLLSSSAVRLADFPKEFGAWQLAGEGEPLSDYLANELGLVGLLNRTYSHLGSGRQVTLMVMVGVPGKLVRHPPNVCYAVRANTQIGEPQYLTPAESPEQSKHCVLEYRGGGAVERHFFVAYAYATGTSWSAPRWPRLEFGGAGSLFKVQALLEASSNPAEDQQLLREFLSHYSTAFAAWQQADAD